jgi:hypothetical protein
MSAESVGSVAEEAAKLFAVLQDRLAGQVAPPAEPADGKAGPHGDEQAATGAPGATADRGGEPRTTSDAAEEPSHASHSAYLSAECRFCPLCQIVRYARATSPEVRAHLADAALSFALAVKGLLENVDAPSERQAPLEKIDLAED